MYYGKKKAIIIVLVVILLVALLAVGGLLVYINTDLFKSNEMLFLKYANMQIQSIVGESSYTQLESIANSEKQMPYEKKSSIEISYNDGENKQNIVNDLLEKTKIEIVTRADKQQNKSESNLKINYDNENLLDIYYANNGDTFALKWQEIVNKYYVGVKNENLKVFAQKIGITENIDQIPDKILVEDYSELLEITEEEKQHIMQTYMQVILNNISKEKYTKLKDMIIVKNGESYTTNAYRLDLSTEDMKNIKIKMLETLKEDSITLNFISTKAKVLKLGEEYTTIEGLIKQIQEKINTLTAQIVDMSKGLSIVLYTYKGQTIQTALILKNEVKITIDCVNNENINVVFENLSDTENYSTATIKLTQKVSNESTQITLNANVDNKNSILVNASIAGLAYENGVVQKDVDVSTSTEEGSYSVAYQEKTTYGKLTQEIVELDNSNCVILNDYPTENLKTLLSSIGQRIQVVFGEKVQKIVTIMMQNNQDLNVNTDNSDI